MTSLKSGAIGFGAGVILTGLLMLWWHNANPKIEIGHETPTTTTVTKPPADFQACDDCVKSKGEIKETINEKNIMHITYEDACKAASKDVTLKVQSPYKYLIMFSLVNTSYSDRLITYGGDVSIYYMPWDRFGIGGGITMNSKSISEHVGIIYAWK
jgi:hypothetical protein